MKVIATPGHALYIDKYRLLISRDLLIAKCGKINICSKELNYDNNMYLQSLDKIKNIEVETIICFHGGVYYL